MRALTFPLMSIHGRAAVRLAALSGAFAGLVMSAAAAPSPVAAAFGGTIVSTYPDGRKAELYLHRDGTYAARGRRGDPSKGRWRVKGDKLCLSQSSPLSVPFDYCTPIPAGGLSAAWSAKAVTGEPIRVRLVKGRAEPAANGGRETPETASSRN
jgi:hypothetical protein